MAETINRGPNVSVGSLMDSRVEAFDGPSVDYQGVVTTDPRFSPVNKDGLSAGRIPGLWNSGQFIVVDAIPSATGTSAVAAAQTPSTTLGVAINLATAQAGTAAGVAVWAPGIPIIPTNTTVPVTVSAIDFGFATGTTAANSTTVVVQDNTLFSIGQWLVVAGAGSGSVTNKALITQVASVSSNGTGLFVSPAAATALNNTPIGQGNLYSNFTPSSPGANLGPAAASANAAEPYQLAGIAKVLDPRQSVCRSINVAAVSSTSGTGSYLVTGYDLYGVPMTELLTVSGTTIVNGKKAFKYISSITVNATATTGTPSNISFGESDVIGFPLRNNKWEYLDIFFGGGFSINNTGYTAAVTTQPATNTTGDVRGTQNASTLLTVSAGGTAIAATGFNGVRRITVNQAIEQASMLLATPLSTSSLYGVPQA